MADWQTVRYDPSYPEPLDAEIIPLCDAMNDAGVVTTASCCGHGVQWPLVCFEDGDEARIERMARHVLAAERAAGDYQPSFSEFNRETQLDGHAWTLHIHLTNVYHDTPPAQALGVAVAAINRVAALVREWAARETPAGDER